MEKVYKKFSFLFAILFLFAIRVSAQFINIENPIARTSFKSLLNEIFIQISSLGAILLAVMIVYSGFLFVTAGGNDAKLSKAKDSIKYVIIGGAIVLGAKGIAELIEQTITG